VHRSRPRAGSLHLVAATLLGLSLGHAGSAGGAEPAAGEAPAEVPPGEGTIEEFLSCQLPDGSASRVSPTPADMPWRVEIGMPRNSPRLGSRAQAREASIAAMRQWERAIQTRLPWFRLEFVEKDASAPVRVNWKRRITGSASGRGGPTCWQAGGRWRAGGAMDISAQACPTCTPLTVDEIRLLVTHEFGHVLGLGHCLDCDSAMNYSWETRDRVFVTRTDVDAVVVHFLLAGAEDRRRAAASTRTYRPEDAVGGADGATPVALADATCEAPIRLARGCSKRSPAGRRKSLDGLDLRLAATADGRTLLVMPPDDLLARGAATPAANERYYAAADALEGRGIRALRATPVVSGAEIVGYFIECDGDAWAALGL
jgi:hypothetical protein